MKFRKLYRGGGYKSFDDRFLIWPRMDRGYKAIDMKGVGVNSNCATFYEARIWCENIAAFEAAEMIDGQRQDQLQS